MLIYLPIAILLFLSLPAIHAAPTSLEAEQEAGQISINNRLLAQVNGKTITVFDVVKKMDLFLSSYYPEAMKSSSGRVQFYMSNWRAVLDKMIDDELILADSEGKDFKITEGDIRQAIFDRLGPNVLASLDKLGMTYEEARRMINEELIVQRMLGAKVHSKAFQIVGPQQIKSAYKEYVAEQNVGEEWEYQVVSIRCASAGLSEQLATHAYALLTDVKNRQSLLATPNPTDTSTNPSDSLSPDNEIHVADKNEKETTAKKALLLADEGLLAVSNTLISYLQGFRKPEDPDFVVNISHPLVATAKTISEAHRKGLAGLEPGMYSHPIAQMSGSDKTPVQRIFFLKKHGVREAPPFEKLARTLRDNLMETAATQEESNYKSKLRQRFSYNSLRLEEIPSNFQPFSFNYAQ